MRTHVILRWRYLILTAIFVQAHASLLAGSIRLSFLDNPAALEGTVRVLSGAGCDKSAVTTFSDMVRRHYVEGSGIDLGSLPDPQNGFYHFSSAQALIKAVPQKLSNADHSYDFNCFDTVILLASGCSHADLGADDPSGPFWVSTVSNQLECVTTAATAVDAYTQLYSRWYRNATEPYFPGRAQHGRVSLTPVLAGWRVLPSSVQENDLAAQGFAVLKSSWRAQHLRFPDHFEVVLFHKFSTQAHTVSTPHAGLLFHDGAGYIYIEKAGGCGPFVRLDFTDRADLRSWLCTYTSQAERNVCRFFASFNDSKIEELISQ
ncbi:MAG: hypothetical protein WCH99_20170 [Verrucomicrobiota bacterium]